MKLPLNLVDGRKCGECTACCTVMGIKDIGKPYYVSCEHLKACGCGIYPDRPQACREFVCVWLHGCPVMTEEDRPDKSGYLFNIEDDVNGTWIEILLLRDNYQINLGRALDIAKWMLDHTRIPLSGIRFIRNNSLVSTQYPLDTTKYPDEGEGEKQRTWGSDDGSLFILVTTDRKQLTPLKVE